MMSEPTPEKEIEVVAGVIEGVTQKKPDTWKVEVKPEGSQYTKKLWTKDSELVTSLTAKLGQAGAFVCGAAYWTNQSGAQVRSLWINQIVDEKGMVKTETAGEAKAIVEATRSVATHDAPVQVVSTDGTVRTEYVGAHKPGSEGMTPEKWDAKERRDYRSRAWAQTLGAFTHTIKTDEDPAAVFARLQPFQRKVFQDVCQSFAYPGDPDDDLPF